MIHQRQAQRQRTALQRAFAAFYADSFEYTEDHLRFLRRRRDAYLQSLRA